MPLLLLLEELFESSAFQNDLLACRRVFHYLLLMKKIRSFEKYFFEMTFKKT
jgi:hypothetical protein